MMRLSPLRAFAGVCVFMVASLAAFCQSVTVTANLRSLTGADVTSGAYFQFTLKAFNGNPVRVVGSAWINTAPIIARPDSSGHISVALEGNDTLTSYVVNDTYYLVEVYSAGAKIYGAPFKITGSPSFDLDAATPISLTPPNSSLPTGSLNYVDTFSNQTIGGNKDFSGTIGVGTNGSLIQGASSGGGTATLPDGSGTLCYISTCPGSFDPTANIAFSGVDTASNLNGVLYAGACAISSPPSWCSGADMGGWVNAAIATLPSLTGAKCGEVSIPAGSYLFATTIMVPRCVQLVGASAYSTYLTYTGRSWAVIVADSSSPNFYPEGAIQDLSLVGPGSGVTSGGVFWGGTDGAVGGGVIPASPSTGSDPASNAGNHFNINRTRISGFGVGNYVGKNSWSDTISQSVICNNGTGYLYPSTSGGTSGQNMGIYSSSICNSSGIGLDIVGGDSDVDFEVENVAFTYNGSWAFYNGAGMVINMSNSHIEQFANFAQNFGYFNGVNNYFTGGVNSGTLGYVIDNEGIWSQVNGFAGQIGSASAILNSAGQCSTWENVVNTTTLGVPICTIVDHFGNASFAGSVGSAALVQNGSNPALTGFERLTSSGQLCWRNAANTADICLGKNSSDQFVFPSIVDSGLTSGTSPVCPNGTNGALTTAGCSGGGMTWPSGAAGIPDYSGSSSWATTYNASNQIPANFISTLNQNTTGQAGTAVALASAPSLCSTGYAPTGVLASGNATGCAAISGGSGLPVTMIYEPSGTSLSTLQSAINGASAGTEFELSGTYSGICGLTITNAGIRLRGMNEYSTTFTCSTAGMPVVTVSGSGGNGFAMYGITVQHVTNAPTCSGGPGTSTCGDGLQILGGSSRVKLENDHFNFNYDNLVLGYTSYGDVVNSEFEYAQGDNIYFLMDPTHTTMQWSIRGGLAEQALGNGVNMTCPSAFSGVQSTAPNIYDFTSYANGLSGFRYSCSAATSSGIADVILDGVTSTTNNGSDILLDLGPAGGRNATVRCVLCELAGQANVGAGFAQSTQTPTGVGDGVTVTSSCDATTPPSISGVFWENSDAGVNTSCAGTKVSEGDYFHNGLASGATATQSDVEVQASNVSITDNYFRNTTNGLYIVSGDTPNDIGNVCDSSVTNCKAWATFPPSGFQSWIGPSKVTVGSGPAGLSIPGIITGTQYATTTNCAVNSTSPAACGSAASGAVVIPTTTTTYTIDTSAVTAHSRIQLTWLSFASDLPSSPTCVAPSASAEPTVSAVSAGTSFTISLASTSGQTCPMFTITN